MDKTYEKDFQNKLLNFSKETSEAGRREIEAALWEEYGAEKVVFVLTCLASRC